MTSWKKKYLAAAEALQELGMVEDEDGDWNHEEPVKGWVHWDRASDDWSMATHHYDIACGETFFKRCSIYAADVTCPHCRSRFGKVST